LESGEPGAAMPLGRALNRVQQTFMPIRIAPYLPLNDAPDLGSVPLATTTNDPWHTGSDWLITARAPGSWLKEDPGAELEGTRVSNGVDLTKAATADPRIHSSELRVVPNVEAVGPELESSPFGKLERLVQG